MKRVVDMMRILYNYLIVFILLWVYIKNIKKMKY